VTFRNVLTALVLGALAFAAVVEVLDAAGVVVPSGVSGEDPVLVAAAVYVGLAACVIGAGAVVLGPSWARAIPLLAAAFLFARFESYDAYYAPTLRRMSDGGLLSPWWVAFVCAAALAATLVRRGRSVAPAVLLVIALTGLIADAGH
jgi:hypothetical protein